MTGLYRHNTDHSGNQVDLGGYYSDGLGVHSYSLLKALHLIDLNGVYHRLELLRRVRNNGTARIQWIGTRRGNRDNGKYESVLLHLPIRFI